MTWRNRRVAVVRSGGTFVGAGAALVGAAAAGFVSSAAAQDWVKQSPYPAEANIRGVDFITPLRGIVVGEDHTFVETFDGGLTWTQMPDAPRDPAWSEEPYDDVFFLDELHAWVVGNNNDAWRTTDGGQTWEQMVNFPAGSYYHIEFLTPTLGYVGGGALVRTQDGGLTWDVLTAWDEEGSVFGFDFRTPEVGVMCNYPIVEWSPYDAGVYETRDGAATWRLLREGVHNDVALLPNGDILAAEPGAIALSTDQGDSWSVRVTDMEEGFSEFFVVDASRVIAVGLVGSIWLSEDGGSTWDRTHQGTGGLPGFWDVGFSDSDHGWLGGDSGWFFKTEDGGRTWLQAGNGLATGWMDLEMADARHGYAVSYSGYVGHTNDGGAWWNVDHVKVTGPIFGRDETLEAVCAVDPDFAVAAGHGGVVFKTEDGGATWQSIGYPELPESFFHDVEFIDHDHGWVIGWDAATLGNALYRTRNGGASWERIAEGQAFATSDMEFLSENVGWTCGASGEIHRTDDGGETWRSVELPAYYYITDMDWVEDSPNVGWAVEWARGLHRTVDGGETWNTYVFENLETWETPVDVAAIDANHAWAILNWGQILETTDGGQTWHRVLTGGQADSPWQILTAIDVLPSNQVWVAGWPGLIIASDPPGAFDLELTQSQLVRGQAASFRCAGAQPGEEVRFLYSLEGIGDGPCPPQLGGLCLDLLNPIVTLGSDAANENGVAHLERPVPENAPVGLDVFTQAVVRRGNGGASSVKSNAIADEIKP